MDWKKKMLRTILTGILLTNLTAAIVMILTDLFGWTNFGESAYLPFGLAVYAFGGVIVLLLSEEIMDYLNK